MDQALGKMPNETSPTRHESGWGQEERLEAATGVCIQTTITDGGMASICTPSSHVERQRRTVRNDSGGKRIRTVYRTSDDQL